MPRIRRAYRHLDGEIAAAVTAADRVARLNILANEILGERPLGYRNPRNIPFDGRDSYTDDYEVSAVVNDRAPIAGHFHRA